MKKIKWHLLLFAFAGIGVAYANHPLHPSLFDLHHYSFWFKNTDGSRIYFGKDLTDAGYVKGIDYDCVPPNYSTCTFQGDPTRVHTDLTGSYFFSWDVPVSGFDNTGVFLDLD